MKPLPRPLRRLLALATLLSAPSRADAPAPAFPSHWLEVTTAMEAELERSRSQLARPEQPAPYYLGYWLVQLEYVHVEAKYGSLVESSSDRTRLVRSELRVGSMELDNSNYFSSTSMAGPLGFGTPMEQAPLEDDPLALRRSLWLLTDGAYQNAIDLLEAKRAERKSSVKQADSAGDFSEATLQSIVAEEVPPLPAPSELEQAATQASRVFVDRPDVHDATVIVDAWTVTRLFVTQDGVRSYAPARFVRHSIQGYTQSDDGMPLTRTETSFGDFATEAMVQAAEQVAEDLAELRRAPVVGDYSGPVLFEGRAAAQLAYELLGEAVSGTPAADGGESPWLRRLGKRVLPPNIDVYDDPTIDRYGQLRLFGGFAFDDEGVPGQRVDLVQRGRLRDLLMSRTPNEQLARSNGHGRAGVGGWARGAIGNLIVEPRSAALGARELRRRLLAQVKEEGAEYGIVIAALEPRDFSTLGAAPPRPELTLRVYPDGRQELVRGAELFEIAPRDLKDVLATGRDAAVHTVTQLSAGAVPMAASIACPALLFEETEIRRPSGAHELPPVLPRPALTR